MTIYSQKVSTTYAAREVKDYQRKWKRWKTKGPRGSPRAIWIQGVKKTLEEKGRNWQDILREEESWKRKE